MYQLSEKDRMSVLNHKLEGYPDGVMADRFEAEIAQTLPVILQLNDGQSIAERKLIYSSLVMASRQKFVEMYGDPLASDFEKNILMCPPSTNEQTLSRELVGNY